MPALTTGLKTPQLTKTQWKKKPQRTIQPKTPSKKQPQMKEQRHYYKRMLAKSEGTENGHHDFSEVGVSPSRTQPVMSVKAFGQVTFSQSTLGLSAPSNQSPKRNLQPG